jgi:hypothetical protein
MSKRLLTIAMGIIIVSATGCTTAIKEGVGVVRGPKGIHVPIEPVAATETARPLGEYTRFEIGNVTDRYNQLPAGFMTTVKAKFRERMMESKIPVGASGKTLILQGDVLYFEMSDMLGKAFGPLEEVIVRTQMVDQATGRTLGIAHCIGRTTNRVNLGVDKKADGLAKAFAEWIKARHPAEAPE